jgi:quercetin dioxygenase-like cupin family protein
MKGRIMKRSLRMTTVVGAMLLTTAGLVGPALATPGTPPPNNPAPEVPANPQAPGSLLAVLGTVDGPVKARQDGITLRAKDGFQVRNFILNYPAHSNSGWHSHPGLVIANVIEGSVTRTLGCGQPQTFTVGEAFVEEGSHFVENKTNAPVRLAITQLIPTGVAVTDLRHDDPVPTCHGKPRS